MKAGFNFPTWTLPLFGNFSSMVESTDSPIPSRLSRGNVTEAKSRLATWIPRSPSPGSDAGLVVPFYWGFCLKPALRLHHSYDQLHAGLQSSRGNS